MNIRKIVGNTTVNVLILVYRNGSVRHRDIAKLVSSRGMLSLTLNSLVTEELISREVKADSIPPQTYYTITEKGRELARRFEEVRSILEA